MSENLKLLCVFAHPDDESLGVGGALVKYAQEGVQTHLVTATRGERGWQGDPQSYPGLQALGITREAELRCAANTLGLREVNLLGYVDGDVDQAEPQQVIAKIVSHIRRIQPHVVVSFPPDGIYGHPDHIAMSQFASAALVCAADSTYRDPDDHPAHRVQKFYYTVAPRDDINVYQTIFGELKMAIDGVDRRAVGWEPWTVTTQVDTEKYWSAVWQAISCHRSQLPGYGKLAHLTEAQHRTLWGAQKFYRVYSLVNGGRKLETDLFEGLR